MQRVRPKDHVLHTNIGWNKVTNPPLHKVTEKQDSLAAYRSLSTQVSQACPSVIRSVRHNDCSSCNANNTVLKRCFLITLDESFHFCYQGAKKKKKSILGQLDGAMAVKYKVASFGLVLLQSISKCGGQSGGLVKANLQSSICIPSHTCMSITRIPPWRSNHQLGSHQTSIKCHEASVCFKHQPIRQHQQCGEAAFNNLAFVVPNSCKHFHH